MNRYVVVGMGRFGIKLVEYLANRGAEVLAIDKERDLVEEVKDLATRAVILDAADEAALKSVGVQDYDTIIVGLGEHFEASVLIVAIAKRLGVKQVIAKAINDLQGEILELVGATEVVYPEDNEAKRLAQSLLEPNIVNHIRLTENHSLIRVVVPEKFVGKTLIDLDIRKKFAVTALEISRGEEDKAVTYTPPDPEFKFEGGDHMVIIGEKEAISKFKKAIAG